MRKQDDARRSRYAAALEQAPELLTALNSAAQSEVELRDEVGLARTLLQSLLAQVGELHGRTGQLNPLALQGVSSLLAQVQSLVRDAAAIEAKRQDQRVSAVHVLTLITALRDDLKRRLTMGFGDTAASVVDEAFKHARWTGGLRDEDVRDALLEPAAFELRLRPVDREGDVVRESAQAHHLASPEIAALVGEDQAVERLDPLAPEEPAEATP